jgi:succinate dehydrogenase/fumarate reductase cytochrome b subunit
MTFFVCLFLFAHLLQGQKILLATLPASSNACFQEIIDLVDPFIGDLTLT